MKSLLNIDNILFTFKCTNTITFLDGAPNSISHFCGLSVHPLVHPSVHLSIHCAPYLRNYTSSDHNLVHMCTMMIFPSVFFIFFFIFFTILVFWVVRGVKGQE